jgi:excisionase family DNA binding protein
MGLQRNEGKGNEGVWMEKGLEELITFEEVSRVTTIKVNTLRKWVTQKKIPYVKVNGAVRFNAEEIKTWLESQAHRAQRECNLKLFED